MIRAWITLACVSLLFFLIVAATFSSLGVVLPAMVGELHWSWVDAGSGFSLLGVFCGITSTIPAMLIRRFGVRVTLLAGSIVMAASFLCLAWCHGLALYFIGCSLAGLGFTLLAPVPGTYLLARLFEKPDFVFGLYFTAGGLSGVAGPLLYFWIEHIGGDWRAYWLAAAVAVALVGSISALLVDGVTDVSKTASRDTVITRDVWRVRDAMKTPQFLILAAAYSIFLFVDITVNDGSVPHLKAQGVSEVMAGSLLSLSAFINAGARLAGGLVSRLIPPRTLLILSLAALIGGLLALSVARDTPMMLIYAAGIGIGSGLTLYASTILLLDYFGRGPNLELFSAVNLISTVGSVGPAFAGFAADHTGSFAPAFLGLAALTIVVLVATALMRAPHRAAA